MLDTAPLQSRLLDHADHYARWSGLGIGVVAAQQLVTLESGDVQDVLLDAESYLELRTERRRVVRDTELELETRFRDYREVGGVMWPHTIEVGPKGRPEKQVVRFEKIEVDPAIDDARFRMPRR